MVMDINSNDVHSNTRQEMEHRRVHTVEKLLYLFICDFYARLRGRNILIDQLTTIVFLNDLLWTIIDNAERNQLLPNNPNLILPP